MKDVAARAGVSLATASRVLSGSSQISPESRSRVMRAASDLNYVANGLARALRRARSDVFGLLVSDIRNPFFSELAHAAEQEAERNGFTLLLANANEDQSQADEYLRTFASQRIDGLLLSPQGGMTAQLASTVASGLPLVLLNRTVPGLDAPMFGTDNVEGVGHVLRWAQRHGHRDMAFVGGPADISTGAERRAAYLAGRQAHGLTLDPRFVDEGDFLAGGGAAAMHRILDRGVQPTAVFGANGMTTVGIVRALHARLGPAAAGVDVVTFDDFEWFELVSPAVSAVRNDAAAIGRLGVRGLMSLLDGQAVISQRVPTTIVDRSTRAADATHS